jgi:hypothetical protein
VVRIAEFYFERHPLSSLKDSHVPRPRHAVAELPKDMISIFVRETLQVGLKDTTGLVPNRPLHPTHSVPAIIDIRTGQQLESVDDPNFWKIFFQPQSS